MMSTIKDKFLNNQYLDAYQRIDKKYPLDLYIGNDEFFRWTLLLVSDYKPLDVSSSRMIFVNISKRDDNKWCQSFSLIDNKYVDIFVLFCEDIVSSAVQIKNLKIAVNYIGKRYNNWKEMLASTNDTLLSINKIKGLIGEMYFLNYYLANKYGIDRSILSWTGPEFLKHDFIINEDWYEVKTTSSIKNEVKISSIEQLDTINEGKLVVIKLDQTSETNAKALNINKLYKIILDKINDDNIKENFMSMLFKFGYYQRNEYEKMNYLFEMKSVTIYNVSNEFPCLRRLSIPSSIISAEYTLSLISIDKYEEEKFYGN